MLKALGIILTFIFVMIASIFIAFGVLCYGLKGYVDSRTTQKDVKVLKEQVAALEAKVVWMEKSRVQKNE